MKTENRRRRWEGGGEDVVSLYKVAVYCIKVVRSIAGEKKRRASKKKPFSIEPP
jgi:hypothetical protein